MRRVAWVPSLLGQAARRVALLGLLGLASAAAHAGTWSDLWSTREQQAQNLLDSKRPAEAAPLFGDPRRRAYAELQAGQYAKAAEHLAPFKDVDSQYNRGNALAHTGQLKDALAAYDAALAQSPGNRDVIRNRDLVARALQEQSHADQKSNSSNSQQRGKGNNKGQSGGAQNAQGANGKDGQSPGQARAGDQGQPNRDGQSASQAQAGSQEQPNKDAQSASQAQAGSQGQPNKDAQSANQAQAGSPAQLNKDGQSESQARAGSQAQPGNPTQSASQSQPGSLAQQSGQSPTPGNASAGELDEASRTPSRPNGTDPVQAMAESGQRGNSRAGDSFPNKARSVAESRPEQPRSEQALALDQWLRGIPEDSGELLRRKFLIEHMIRQQGNEP